MEQLSAGTAHNRPFAMDIQLIYGPIGVVSAVTRWISEEEMEIDTGRVVLEDLSNVEISFAHRVESDTFYHRIHAHVSAHHQGTVTLRFHRCPLGARHALRQLIERMQ